MFKKRLKSFSHAINGLVILIKVEPNARIHLLAAIVVILLAYILKISINEWALIVISIGFVFCAELVNTSIENLSDLVTKEYNPFIKKVKDLGAAAVLVAAFTAIIIA
ncbi:MAG: diacylglycerol kinase family protein, partial [Flavobacteriales bacterium]|nr:diacylglycerol kinase family protein [Flavobacteriales bacterium]